MVVGVYGLLYWHAAWRLDTAWPIIAVGLLGKVLGPIGMVLSFSETWPLRLGLLCVFNDLIWWLPFGLFLLRGTRAAPMVEKSAPWICAGLHAGAFALMAAVLRGGSLVEVNTLRRARYVAEHQAAWRFGWSAWMLSALSLVGFYAWWGSRASRPVLATAGVLLAAIGSVFDLSGESLSVLVLAERAQLLEDGGTAGVWDSESYIWIERVATLLTAGAANALYTLGGIALMFATPNLPAWIKQAMWVTWLAGAVMTLAAIGDYVPGMVASTAILFPLLIAWTVWLGARWDSR
jgi:hypothetical protein